MKVANAFRAFLETYHYLQLPLLGRFTVIDSGPGLQNTTGKLIEFAPAEQVVIDPHLTGFIAEKLKMDSNIAESDLRYFCSAVKELLIQGFEAEIPGIGFLHFLSPRQLKFTGKGLYKTTEPRVQKRVSETADSFWY